MTTEAKDKTDNELIAEFFAAKKHLSERGRMSYLLIGVPAGFDRSTWYEAGAARFHESWDWLMPVVEKIGQLKGNYTVSINTQKEPSLYGHECSIYDIGHAVHMLVESKNLIDCVYRTVVEFIRWYNANQPNP